MAADGNSTGAHVAARLAADGGAVAKALAAAEEFLRACDGDPDLRARLAIIVEELVMNVVEHGEPPPGDVIGLTLRAEPDGVRLILTDGGKPFDLRAAVPTGPNLERGGGAGIALVLAWSRIVGYFRQNERNRLELFVPREG